MTVSQRKIEEHNSQLSNHELKVEYLKSFFKIVRINFRSKAHRMAAEAFYIQMNRPQLNEKNDRGFSNFLESDMFYFLQSYKMSNYRGVKLIVYYNTKKVRVGMRTSCVGGALNFVQAM